MVDRAENQVASPLSAVFDWVDNPLEMALSGALEATDPDPTAPNHANEALTVENFRSVTQLLPQYSSNPLYGVGYGMAEVWTNKVRALPVAVLLTKLAELEKKAFQYDPKTKEAPIVDRAAYLVLKNYLKAVERAAFQDKKYLKEVNRKEMDRFSILVSEEVGPRERGIIYRIEQKELDALSMWEAGQPMEMDLLQHYDGEIPLLQHPFYKGGAKLEEYAKLCWTKEEIKEATKKYWEKHGQEYQTMIEQHVSAEEREKISKVDDLHIVNALFIFAQQATLSAKDRGTNVKRAFAFLALNRELGLRGIDESLRVVRSAKILADSVFKEKPENPPLYFLVGFSLVMGLEAIVTQTRLDDYNVRNNFIVFENEMPSEEYGFFVSVAKMVRIPFDAETVLTAASESPPFRVTNKALTWNEVRKMGTVTLPVRHYPPKGTSPAEENEWDYLRQIHYNGASVYDLVRLGVETVTLASDIKMEKTGGLAHGLFRNVEIGYLDAEGRITPFYQRLQILVHEAYHSLHTRMEISGLGATLSTLDERGAYFFGAYVLEEYLKLRLASPSKPTEEETMKILSDITISRVRGLVANSIIQSVFPDFNREDCRIEIPLTEQQKIIEKAKQKTDGLLALKEDPANVFDRMVENDKRTGAESTSDFYWYEVYRVGDELGISRERIFKFYSR
ncbi:MAG: hypothetical protein A3H42_02130 [Deltaproteobacteria bacterium RIFCSPLOWO2_02_FULL_46_8]|nr:MAG: hypothetical protein A3H42_02130 [Deltaproteobacteria bacterium RIFCSPLOWO2_02_FULL_46_8]